MFLPSRTILILCLRWKGKHQYVERLAVFNLFTWLYIIVASTAVPVYVYLRILTIADMRGVAGTLPLPGQVTPSHCTKKATLSLALRKVRSFPCIDQSHVVVHIARAQFIARLNCTKPRCRLRCESSKGRPLALHKDRLSLVL